MPMLFRDLIDNLDYEELVKIKKDLDLGGVHIKRLINFKIKEKEMLHKRTCAHCGKEIDPFNLNNYTVIFGPEDFKKKVTFCAYDCMKYFMDSLNSLKSSGENIREGDVREAGL